MNDSTSSVLVVDDNRSAAQAIAMLLEREGFAAEAVYDGQTAIRKLQEGRFDLVLTDLRMEPIDGLAVVAAARRCEPPVEAIVFTAYGSVEVAVEAMHLGASDFLTKPVTADVIVRRVREIQKDTGPTDGTIVGISEHTAQIRSQAGKLARVRSTVLLTGEIGVGRRHLARWLHHNGPDSDRPLRIARPNRRITPEILEEAGTLLVPSVDSWDHSAQTLLQQQLETLEPGRPPRVIATSSPELDQKVSSQDFRPDLYFRLAVLVVPIAPLRARSDDIAPLLDHFLEQNAQVFGQSVPTPRPDQMARLRQHEWPGNIRELANLAERAAVLGDVVFDMPIKRSSPEGLPELGPGFNLSEHLEEMERAVLLQAIEQTGGDRPQMSRLLGLERNTLRYKLNKYKLLKRT